VSQARHFGVAEADLKRLICPIGLREIKGKELAVIAAAVAAQLLIAREG
jgi:xanthine dehydrogenase accessory factor